MHSRRRRALGAMGAMWLVLAGLMAAFFHTQVMQNPAFAMQSERNRLRPLSLPAPRGTIVDREGRILADNVPGYALSLLPAPRDSIRSTLERLTPYLELTDAQLDYLMVRQREAPQQPLLVASDVPFDRVSAIEERRPLFPEMLIDMRPKRNYPAGRATAHLIGYVGEISAVELESGAFEGYRPGQLIGKTGVERVHETGLSGVDGVRYVEVDALGRIVRDFAGYDDIDPVAGEGLRLTVDLGLQRWIDRIMGDTLRGAMVALDPATSEVLALYSTPSFDPNALVGTVRPERWEELRQDTARRLLNRAVAGLYPPASTWKLATAAIALKLGVVDPEATLPTACRGGMRYGNRYFRCWVPEGHGYLDMAGAIAHSCDVYFYQLGLQIGLRRLLEEGTALGFSRATGVDLPSERAGHFPPGPEWYERRFGWAATEAEALSLAIGQGANDQTAMKMAQFYVALATDGTAPAPRVTVGAEPGEVLDLEVDAEHLEWLREGLRGVTARGGTAAGSAVEHWDWIGKTGTAQNPHGEDHGWFVGIAGPRNDPPEIVVAVIVEEGEHGSDVAQLAAKAADYYLRSRRGMPIDTTQTLREHWLRGVPAPWARWD